MTFFLCGEVGMFFVWQLLFIFGVLFVLLSAREVHRQQRNSAYAYVNSANKCLEQIAKAREAEESLKKEMDRIAFYAEYGVDKSGSFHSSNKINSYPAAYVSAMSRSK
ncbi:MAG: hypothetical protein ACRDD9_23700 [Shewanella sp.]